MLASESNQSSSGGNTLPNTHVLVPIPRLVSDKMDKICQQHGGKLFTILSVPVIDSLHKQFIKYRICGGGALGMIYITYSAVILSSLLWNVFPQQLTEVVY